MYVTGFPFRARSRSNEVSIFAILFCLCVAGMASPTTGLGRLAFARMAEAPHPAGGTQAASTIMEKK